ncbi:hypothetical protein HDU76_007747 [Blyttiomyces sp. JEL0837]|nr:hypothetical protein HDU76_007747 [Blyttiomyces sp. JEL0837]
MQLQFQDHNLHDDEDDHYDDDNTTAQSETSNAPSSYDQGYLHNILMLSGGSGEASAEDILMLQQMAASGGYLRDPLADDETTSSDGSTLTEVAVTKEGGDGKIAMNRLFTEDHEHFTVEEFGNSGSLKFYDDRIVSQQAKYFLFPKMRPRQFLIGKTLHRERAQRKVSWDELFLDLVYVAVTSKAGSLLRHPVVTGEMIAQFTATFVLIYQAWSSIEANTNRYGIQGFGSRLTYWLYMVLAAGMGINILNAWNPDLEKNTGNNFMVTYLITRFFCMGTLGLVAWSFPKFGYFLGLNLGFQLLGTTFYIASLFTSLEGRVILWWSGFFWDTVIYGFVIYISRVFKFKYRVAINIEHHTERIGLLVIIVLGEVVVSLLWSSKQSSMSRGYAATLCGLTVAIAFEWLYFNIDATKYYIHAIRRSVITAVVWQNLHLPFCMALVAAGAALGTIVTSFDETGVNESVVGLWGASLAIAMFCMIAISLTHKGHDHEVRIPRNRRVWFRGAVGIVLAGMAGFGRGLDSLSLALIPACLLMGLTILEEYGRLKDPKKLKDGHHHHHHHHDHEHKDHDHKDNTNKALDDNHAKELKPGASDATLAPFMTIKEGGCEKVDPSIPMEVQNQVDDGKGKTRAVIGVHQNQRHSRHVPTASSNATTTRQRHHHHHDEHHHNNRYMEWFHKKFHGEGGGAHL